MALETIANINVDFYQNKYIQVNAKQYDSCSRWIAITCYNQGKLFTLNANQHFVYVKYKKADGNAVLNSCRINYKGEALVELTEQMLAADGMCYVDLVVINKGSAIVNVDTGEIINIDNTPILSTMAFCVYVYETSVDNSVVESSYEFNVLNDLMQKANAEYTEIVQLSKSYAVGKANGIRDNEDNDNAKYYYEQSLNNSNNAKASEQEAKTSETNAKTSEINALNSEQNAKTSETNSKTSETNAKASEQNAKKSEQNALISKQNANASEINAKASEQNAKTSETNSKTSETNAKASEIVSLNSANLAKSYAVGETGTRENEDVDNARYYCEVIKNVLNGLNSGYIPMGTISFSQLSAAQKATGFTYNIKDDFTTDNTFKEGAGKPYTAGTNVYYTADGFWDCLGGSTAPMATVDEIRDYLSLR